MGRLGDHPHIVTIYDIGDEEGQPYIVSQYMAGGSIADLIASSPEHRIPLDMTLRLADEVCQALDHAHKRAIIHRDLKPGNVWLTTDGTAKLGDFGLAVASDRSRLTVEGMMVGTVAYLPPEQAVGRTVDARSDLYSLGAMLYEMLCGRPPFSGEDLVSVISQHLNTAPVAPSWHNPAVPRSLESIVMRLLAKAPQERPESADVVRQALSSARSLTTSTQISVSPQANPLDRLAGGVFVGRDAEMDELRAALEDALSGRGRMMLLVGEPGIGKTRTSDELATFAGLRGCQVLWGQCYEEKGAPAFWPWVQIIRGYVHDIEPKELMSQMGAGAADIAQVVSDVRERLPGLPTPSALEPEQARFRLFDSITTFLRSASRVCPLMLVLDDLHWADKPSLLLLQFLARELRGSRILVVGTYRDVALNRQHPLSQTLGELGRERLRGRVVLRGLTAEDVAKFIELTSGVSPPLGLVDALYRETEGNPFFVNEIVRLLVTEGRLQDGADDERWSLEIPEGVRDVIGRRLDRLSSECNSVITVASAIGREFSLEMLERVAELPDEQVAEVLEEAVAARVITELQGVPPRYSFAHALIRETLYDELSTTRRVRLHRRIGESLEELHASHVDAHLPELAHHFLEASQGGDVDKAVDYAVRAGARATELLAYEEAAGHFERALQSLDANQIDTDETKRCDLLLSLGDALGRIGAMRRAREHFGEAALIARRLGAAERLARASLGMSTEGLVPGVVEPELIQLLEESLDGLDRRDSALRVRVTARLSKELYYTDERDRRERLSREAIAMARRVGDISALAAAVGAGPFAVWTPDNPEERLALATELADLARRAGRRDRELQGMHWQVTAALELGDAERAEGLSRACTRLAGELRQPLYLWQTKMLEGLFGTLRGSVTDAERLAEESAVIGQRVRPQAMPQFSTALLFVPRWEQGRIAELEPDVSAFTERFPGLVVWRCALAWIYGETGRDSEARSLLDQIAFDDFATLHQQANMLTCVAALAEACALVDDARRAALLYDLAARYADRCVVIAPGITCWGSAHHFMGLLAATMRRWDDAVGHFEAAIQKNTHLGTRTWVAHTQYRYASVLAQRQSGDDARHALDLLAQVLEIASELGQGMLQERALRLKLDVQGVSGRDTGHSIAAVSRAVQSERPDLRPHAAPDGTVTILFSDIASFTELNERLGDRRGHEVLRRHNSLLREQVATHDGFEVKSEGDGFMLAFASARRAALCAVAVQRKLAEYNEQHPDEQVRVRMGLHTGEAIHDAGDFYGRNVILAARIADQASGGEILASSLFKQLTESSGDLRFESSRQVELKGLSGVETVHALSWQ